MNISRKTIALTPGSEEGVGPELMLKATCELVDLSPLHFFWCSDQASLLLAAERSRCELKIIGQEHAQLNGHVFQFLAHGFDEYGLEARQALSLKRAVELAKKGAVQAIVTGPIEKSALAHLDGSYPGQTEYFAAHLAKPNSRPFMAFLGGPFALSLLSVHCPLKDVARRLTKDHVFTHLKAAAGECGALLKKAPSDVRICVLGLNPHAGENGLLGREEMDAIAPAIAEARKLGLHVEGPLPADGFFSYYHALKSSDVPDLLVATYHDQGLIPYKLLAKGRAVNATLGLIIPRTSPSHGTAVPLAGTGKACPKSTAEAIRLASILSRNAHC